MSALDALRDRLAELADLNSLASLAAWDQRTMMPPEGGPARAHAMATLERLSHERATAGELGAWIVELEADGDGLDDVGRDLVRLARRDWDRQTRVPNDLAAALAQAGAEGQDIWQAARATNDFGAFAPALRRNVELARAYAACLTLYWPLTCLATSSESLTTSTSVAPSARARCRPSSNPRYSATLLVVSPSTSVASSSTAPSGAETTAAAAAGPGLPRAPPSTCTTTFTPG